MKSALRSPLLRPFLSVLPLLACLPSSPSAFAQALTPEQFEKIQQELNRIEGVVEEKRISSRSSAVSAFQKGAASDKAALDLYFECFKEVRFDRQDARSSDYRDWREKNEERVKEKENLAALRLQLQYLVLTLRAAEGVSRETLIPELESFAASIVANANEFEEGLKRLREPVNATVFAQAYGLDKSLKVDNWSFNPGNFDSIYNQSVLPFYRESQPEALAAAWDRKIKLETDFVMATSEKNPSALETFKTETLPQLQFQKGRDMFAFCSQQQGALTMINLLKNHPDHPRAGDWLQEFRELLVQAMIPAPAAPAP